VLLPCALIEDIDASSLHEYYQQTLLLSPKDEVEIPITVLTEWTPTLIESLEAQLRVIGIQFIHFHQVCFKNYKEIIQFIPSYLEDPFTICLQLVDGQESDGWIGVSVIEELEKKMYSIYWFTILFL